MKLSKTDNKKLFEIAVLYGGKSTEREISLKTGMAVTEALEKQGHSIRQIDPLNTPVEYYDWTEIDVVFICLHGEFGEDGSIQRILENAHVCFTGCNSEISQIAYSKSATKDLFLKNQIPTPAFQLIHETATAGEINSATEKVGFPLVVKPDTQGSSLGINLVNNKEELPQALSQAFHFDEFILIEQAVLGSEWTMGFIDEEPLPLIKIETGKALFDYDAKYTEKETKYLFEFEETTNVIKKIEATCQSVVSALGTKDLTRVDIRLDKHNTPYILELNTIPGMTEQSLIPKAALMKGISFVDLCDRIVQSAWEKDSRKTPATSVTTSFTKKT